MSRLNAIHPNSSSMYVPLYLTTIVIFHGESNTYRYKFMYTDDDYFILDTVLAIANSFVCFTWSAKDSVKYKSSFLALFINQY